MSKISIIHPSRGRAQQAADTFKKWMSAAHDYNEVEYILSIDRDDSQMPEYLQIKGIHQKIVSYNASAIEAINEGAKFASTNLFVVVSDDFDCPLDWDKRLLEALNGKEDYVVKTDDGCQPWIITLPIMDRAYYSRFGYIYNNKYLHMFCDTEMTHVADLLDKKITLPIKFPHNHYTQIGGYPKDAINIKNDATWAQGEAVYLEGARNNFGLKDFPGTLRCGLGHMNWLERKGIII